MIQGLYETHIEVSNLEKAIDFYKSSLGLEFALLEKKRRIAFFWVGKTKEYMLGLWEKEKVHTRHFAFRCEKEFILNEAANFLKQRKLKPYNFLQNGTEEPMVFSWMPALAIYFDDPDGNVLEFIAILEGKANPSTGIVSYEEWSRENGG